MAKRKVKSGANVAPHDIMSRQKHQLHEINEMGCLLFVRRISLKTERKLILHPPLIILRCQKLLT